MKIFKIVLYLSIFIWNLSSSKADTLKIHVVGDFRGETYQIYYDSKVFTRKMGVGIDAFAFFIYIPDTIKDKQCINMHVYRKGRFKRKYKDIQLDIFYDDRSKYLVLLSDHRLKKKYTLSAVWGDHRFLIKDPFWDKNIIPEWAKCDSIKDSNLFSHEKLIK